MSKKVFISHASGDEQIVSLFVDYVLCAGCGVQLSDIVYTSREDTGVANGEDIPLAIREGIRCSAVFIMMVSEYYRKSEVCLNEMGAAWMDDKLSKKILVLPGVEFDQIGWLMSLKKGTRIADGPGLDVIHDDICEVLSLPSKTATWNRNRDCFISEVNKLSTTLTVSDPAIVIEEEEDLDMLDHRENYNFHTQEYTRILGVLSVAIAKYKEKVEEETGRMNKLQHNPSALNPGRIREIMVAMAREIDLLAEVFEVNAPLLQSHFGQSISSAIALQQFDGENDTIKQDNRNAYSELMETMKETKKNFSVMRDSMSEIPDLDKTFRKSKKRLQIALNGMLDVIDYCIRRANELQIV